MAGIVSQPFKLAQALSGGAAVEERKEALLTLIPPTPSAPAAPGGGSGGRGAVMVAGATGGVGKRVVALLLQRGLRVRALVRCALSSW